MNNRTDELIGDTWIVMHILSLFLVILKLAEASPIDQWPWFVVLLPFIFDGFFLLFAFAVMTTLYVLSRRYRHK